jgi:hypothetical protein
VAGGIAVLLHGIDRLTAAIDLVVDLAPEEASKAVNTLLALGCKAQAPIDARQFAGPVIRGRWQAESAKQVLRFWDRQNRRRTVDLFADDSMDFETLFGQAVHMPLTTTRVRVASIELLIAIKRDAGRGKGREEASELELLARRDRS